MHHGLHHRLWIKKTFLIALTLTGIAVGWWYYRTAQQPTVSIIDFSSNRDTAFILDLFKQNWYWLVSSPDFSAEYVLAHRAPSRDPLQEGLLTIKVMYQGQEPLGFVAYYKKSFYVGFVLFLSVRSEFRSKGYGEQLLRYAVEELRRRGASVIRLVTRVENYPAQAVYKKVGFVETRRDAVYVDFEKRV